MLLWREGTLPDHFERILANYEADANGFSLTAIELRRFGGEPAAHACNTRIAGNQTTQSGPLD
jgi:hypothetical protein